jgi:cytochrome c oxidase assembly protein subunit 15
MGCPDWPTCFGLLIPPTDISQLPADYQERFSSGGTVHVDIFNPVKTWTEYINRLIGVLCGFSVIITTFLSRKLGKSVFYPASISLILIVLEGWIGARVVASNLKPVVITIHLLLAYIILFLLMYAVAQSEKLQNHSLKPISWQQNMIILLAVLLIIQGFLGTRIREQTDLLAKTMERASWVQHLDAWFYIHRSFSWVVLLLGFWIHWKNQVKEWNKHWIAHQILVFAIIFSGMLLNYTGYPAYAQPLHLLFSALIIANLEWLYIREALLHS